MLVHEFGHFLLSLLAGSLIFKFCRKWTVFIFAIISGFVIDVDHLFDYFFYKKVFTFNLHEFLSGFFFKAAGKVYILFHGFEYAIVAIGLGLVLLKMSKTISEKRRATAFFVLAFGISLSFHLILDTLTYKPKWPTYFISYRIFNNFGHDQLGFK